MLLTTSRICARPVTFYNNFDKYNGNKCSFVSGQFFLNFVQMEKVFDMRVELCRFGLKPEVT